MIMIFITRKLSHKSGFQRGPENSIKLQYIYMYFETLHGEISCVISNFVEHHVSFK